MRDAKGLGILWDMDGTLVDTAELHFAAWLAVCKEQSRDFSRADFAATFGRHESRRLSSSFSASGSMPLRSPSLVSGKRCFIAPRPPRAFRCCRACAPCCKSGTVRGQAGDRVECTAGQSPGPHPESHHGCFFHGRGGGYMEDTQRGKPDPQVFLISGGEVGIAAIKVPGWWRMRLPACRRQRRAA